MQLELTSTKRKKDFKLFRRLPSGSAKCFYTILLLLLSARGNNIADPLHSKPAPQLTLLNLDIFWTDNNEKFSFDHITATEYLH